MILASYVDILWFVTYSSSPMRVLKPREHSLPLLAGVQNKPANYAPKIGWRSHENYFRATQGRLIM